MAMAWCVRVSSRIGTVSAGGIGAGRNQDATWNRKRRRSTLVRVVNPGSEVNPGGEPNRWASDRGERLAGDRGGQPRDGRGSAVAPDRFRRGESLSNHRNEGGGGKRTFSCFCLEGRGQQGVRGVEVVRRGVRGSFEPSLGSPRTVRVERSR